MIDFLFDGFKAYNMIGFFIGGLIMALIGGLIAGDWIYWRMKSTKVKGRIVAIRSSGVRRDDAAWEKEYKGINPDADPEGLENFAEHFVEDFKKNPKKAIGRNFLMLIFVFVPVLFFGFGAYTAYDFLALKASGVQTTAVVSKIESYDSDDGTMYTVFVRFDDSEGIEREVRDRLSTGGKASYKEDERLTVYYDRDNPEHMIIDDFWHYMVFALMFMGISSIFIIVFFGGLFFKLADGGDVTKGHNRKVGKIKRQHYSNQHYTAIYEYRDADGQMVQAEGRTATNWLADKVPGATMTLMIRPDRPDEAETPGIMMPVFGLVFLLPGLFLIGMAVSQMEFNPATILLLLAGAGFTGWKIKGTIIPKEQRESKEEFAARRAEKRKLKKEKKKKDGYIMTAAEIRERMVFLDRQALITVPIVMLFSILIIAGGFHLLNQMQGFSERGVRVDGEVAGIDSRRSSDGDTMYYAVVSFTTAEGQKVRFDDKAGGSSPLYRAGDRVKVLYDGTDPTEAIIDRGMFNWVLPYGLIGLGMLMAWWSLRTLAGINQRARRVL